MGATHDPVRLAAFDQFPYSHHLESGVVLVKRVGGGGVGGDDADADADADGDGAALGEKRKAAEEGDEAEKRAKTA